MFIYKRGCLALVYTTSFIFKPSLVINAKKSNPSFDENILEQLTFNPQTYFNTSHRPVL